MRFLFVGQGYPDLPGTGSGSGIGTYLREITLGLSARGHECHVICWQEPGPDEAYRRPPLFGMDVRETEKDGVRFWLLAHSYWPLIERLAPDSRDTWNLRRLAFSLDRRFRYDRVEIESEEGIGIGVQRAFGERVLLRVYTTLATMVLTKEVVRDRTTQLRLRREHGSLLEAHRIAVPSRLHAEELQRMFPGIVPPDVLHIGIDLPRPAQSPAAPTGPAAPDTVQILVVGSADRRKGFDRLRPVIDTCAFRFAHVRFLILSRCSPAARREYRLEGGLPPNVQVEIVADVSADELTELYRRSTVLLHLARYESFALPLIEAAATGLPVVTTRIGVAPELLNDLLEKYVVEGDAPEKIADAIQDAVRNRLQYGGMMRQRYLAAHTREAMVNRYLAFCGGVPHG